MEIRLRNFLPTVRLCQIKRWAEGNDPGRINLRVRHIIMALDVVEVDRVGDAWLLIQIRQVALQIRVIDDAAQVALEMAVINHVEPDKRAKKSPVRFDDAIAEQISTVR